MSFTGKPTNANELILWNGTNFYSGKITGNNIDPASTTTIQINGEFIGTSFGINNGTTIPTLASGTGVPSTTPPNGSLFMRTDGTSSTGLYTYQSGTWVSVTGSSSFTAGGDLTGTSTNQTVIAIQGNAIESGTLNSTEDGYVLTWVNASSQWQPKPTLGETVTIYGDVTGTTTASTVVAIQGNTVTAGALTKGQFLVATSTSNWASTSLSGDISESATTPGQLTVLKINGTSVPATPTANQVLVATSGTTSTWAQIVDANVASGASISYSKLNLSNSIVNADINTSAGISGSKITPNFGTQSLTAGTSILGTSTSANSITGSLTFTTVTETTTYTVDSSEADYYVFADTTGGAWTLTLPAPTNGRTIVVKDSKQNFATANLTVARHGSEKIDGVSASLVLNINNQEVVFASNGTDWFTDNFARSTTGSAGGDLSGTYPNPTVAKVDGVSYPANPSTNTVPVVTGTNTVTYQQIADAQVSATASISGSKINPNFGTQAIIGASLDTSTATTLYLGTATANSVQIGTIGNTTTVLGNLTVNGAETIVGASTFQASSVFDGNVTVADGYSFTVVGSTGGTFSINGDGNSSVTTGSGSLTITSASATTWSTSAGALNVSGFGGLNLQNNGVTQIAVSSGGVTIGTTTDANSIVGSLKFTTRTASSSFNVDNTTTDMLIYANTSGGAFNITLPAPTNGRTLIIKDSTQSFATNNLTIVRHASENIDGVGASLVLATNNEEVILTSDGTNWFTNLFANSTTGTAGGDLSGTYPNPTVAKINGSTVPAGGSLTTGNVLQVSGSSALTYGAVNLAGGTNYVTGNLPVSNVAPGTSGQVLMSNGTPATTWTSFSGDVTVNATGTTKVNSISGTSPIAISAATLNFTGGTGNLQSNGTTIASVVPNKLVTTGIRRNVTAISGSTYTVLATDDIIAADPSSNTIAITLPSSPTTGDTLVVKDVTGHANTNSITITPASGNIDGASNFIVDMNYASITIVYTGSQWSVL